MSPEPESAAGELEGGQAAVPSLPDAVEEAPAEANAARAGDEESGSNLLSGAAAADDTQDDGLLPDEADAGVSSDDSSAPSEQAEAPTGVVLRGAVEAILLVVDEPVSRTMLAQVLKVPEPEIAATLAALQADYDETERGFELREVGGGWRLYTRAAFAVYVERFVLDGQQARLTQAALETLAVVAYRQPVSRSRVSAVRGVNVDGVMRTLVSRGLVEESGADPETSAVLYRTTPYFLERLGIRDLTALPKLADYLPEGTTIDDIEDQLSIEGRDG